MVVWFVRDVSMVCVAWVGDLYGIYVCCMCAVFLRCVCMCDVWGVCVGMYVVCFYSEELWRRQQGWLLKLQRTERTLHTRGTVWMEGQVGE